ncbi:MAG: CvpA family protein [Firmicutes bacterium]|nr:CvpA family protein [Bacillota bacterium]
MDWLNLALGAYLAWGALQGLRRGLLGVGFSLAGYVIGILLAAHAASPLSRQVLTAVPVKTWIGHYLPAPAAGMAGARSAAWRLAQGLTQVIAFLLIVGAIEFVGRTVGSVLSQALRACPLASWLNRLGGMAAGIAEHGVVAGLVLSLLVAIPGLNGAGFSGAIRRSPLANITVREFHHLGRIPGLKDL